MEVHTLPTHRSVKKQTKEEILITHTINVSPPVRKYLETWLPGLYRANQNDFVGMWLINALTRKTKQVQFYVREQDIQFRASKKIADAKSVQFLVRDKDIERWGIEDAKKFGYMDTWKFAIPERYQDNVVLPKRRVIQFNNMIMKFIYAEMFANMESRRIRGEISYIQKVIYDFREKYKMNDNEFTDERVRKAYLRFRESSKTATSEFFPFFAGSLLKY